MRAHINTQGHESWITRKLYPGFYPGAPECWTPLVFEWPRWLRLQMRLKCDGRLCLIATAVVSILRPGCTRANMSESCRNTCIVLWCYLTLSERGSSYTLGISGIGTGKNWPKGLTRFSISTRKLAFFGQGNSGTEDVTGVAGRFRNPCMCSFDIGHS